MVLVHGIKAFRSGVIFVSINKRNIFIGYLEGSRAQLGSKGSVRLNWCLAQLSNHQLESMVEYIYREADIDRVMETTDGHTILFR